MIRFRTFGLQYAGASGAFGIVMELDSDLLARIGGHLALLPAELRRLARIPDDSQVRPVWAAAIRD